MSCSLCAAAATIADKDNWRVVPDTRGAGQWGCGTVYGVDSCLPRGEVGGELSSHGVVGVHVAPTG